MKTKHSGSLLYGLFNDRLSKIRKDPFQILNITAQSEKVCMTALNTLFGNCGNISHCFNFIGNTLNLIYELQYLEVDYNTKRKYLHNEKEISQLDEWKIQNTVKVINTRWPDFFQAVLVDNKNANPSEYFKLLAVISKSSWIAYMDNPSINLQSKAIDKDPFSIIYLKNPSENIQLSAIKLNPYCVCHINGLTDKATSKAKEYINASESRKFEALSVCSGNIAFINNPSEQMFELVHENDPYYFTLLTNIDFITAIENEDFTKIAQLKEQGYQPSKEAMQIISEVTPKNIMVTVQKIYGMNTNISEDIKLAQASVNEEKTKQVLATDNNLNI